MQSHWTVKAFFGIFLFVAVRNADGAAINVAEWQLQTRVVLGGIGSDGDSSFVPSNPFSSFQSAQRSNSTATSSILADWDASGHLDFYLEAEHHCQGTPGDTGLCRSTGSILFVTAVDSVLTLDAEYNYALGNGDREANQFVRLSRDAPLAIVFEYYEIALPIAGHPPAGSHSFEQTLLPQGAYLTV